MGRFLVKWLSTNEFRSKAHETTVQNGETENRIKPDGRIPQAADNIRCLDWGRQASDLGFTAALGIDNFSSTLSTRPYWSISFAVSQLLRSQSSVIFSLDWPVAFE